MINTNDNACNDAVDELVGLLGKETKKKAVKLPTQHSIPSRGLKFCPSCKKYVGVRSSICQCGHTFPIVEKKEKVVDNSSFDDPPLSDEDKRYARAIGASDGGRIVHVGSGPPPATLNGLDAESVNSFCDRVSAEGLSDKKVYMPTALKSWVGCTLDRNCEDYMTVATLIDTWYDEKVLSTMSSE